MLQRELASNLLKSVAEELETAFRAHHSCNTMLARYAGDATLILGFNDLTPRFSRLLKQSKREGFYGGVITSKRLPWFVPRRERQLTPIEKINTDHPAFTDDFPVETFAKFYPEMLPCLGSGFDALLDAATTELAIEEIALSQAILGRYNDAINTSSRLKESHRRNNVQFVIGIEQFRLGLFSDFQAFKDRLEDGTLAGWGGAQFALGICNRVPWCPYPFPDY